MKIRDITLIGILSASITASKLALSFIPNVELVTLLFMVYTVVFGIRKSLFISVIFTITEIFIYGFSTWLLVYFIIWPMLILITGLGESKVKSEYGYALIGGVFGYSFGAFFAVFESIFYGLAYGWAYWIKGIPFDLIHGTSNFIVIVMLYKPLLNILMKLKTSYYNI